MGHVRDLWTDPPPEGARRRVRNERWGRGKRWLATWSEDGRVRSKAFAAKEVADTWIHARDLQLPIARPSSSLTVRELTDMWSAAQLHHRKRTRESIRSTMSTIILPTLGDLRVADLDRAILQDAVTQWSQRWSASRVRVAWSYVTSSLRLAEADLIIDRRPAGVRTPRVERVPVVPLTDVQVLSIADAVAPHWRSMVLLGAASGLRSGELRGLTWDRIVGDVLVVDRQLVGADRLDPVFGPPKSRAGIRRVRVDASALAVLGDRGEGLVWRTRHGTPVTTARASQVWRSATAEMSGLRPRSGWHDLRHYHASLLISQGLSARAVADRLGHADPVETLRVYSHLWPTDEERAVGVTGEVMRRLLGDPHRAATEQG